MVFVFRTCKICGKPISRERLFILPETRYCVECAEKYGTDMIITESVIGMDLETYKDLLGAVRS